MPPAPVSHRGRTSPCSAGAPPLRQRRGRWQPAERPARLSGTLFA